jgi:quinol monooxygenase YgiN
MYVYSLAIKHNVEVEDDLIIILERYADKDADRRHFEHPRREICFADIKEMTEGQDRRGFYILDV